MRSEEHRDELCVAFEVFGQDEWRVLLGVLGLYDAHGEVKVELVRVVEGSVFLVGDETGSIALFSHGCLLDIRFNHGNVATFGTQYDTP